MKTSIRQYFTLIFVLLVAVLIITMYGLFSFFLPKYYREQKIKLLGEAYFALNTEAVDAERDGTTLLSLLEDEYDQNTEDSPLISMFRSISERSNIDIVMIDDSGTIAANSRESEWNAMKLKTYVAFSEIYGDDIEFTFPIRMQDNNKNSEDMQDKTQNPDDEIADNQSGNAPEQTENRFRIDLPWQKNSDSKDPANDNKVKNQPIELLNKDKNYTLQLFSDRRSGTQYLECWGKFSDGNTYFLMTMPIVSIDESAKTSMRLLINISLVILVIGAVAVYFTTGIITKPINELAHISERMSELDFSVHYTGRARNEIGVLGESMNVMSEKLESTISELKAANAQLQEDIDLKIKVDDIRKEFIADVSHELKTPIAIIEGYAEGLVEGMADDKDMREYYCGVIMDESQKMSKMVRQLTSLINYEFGDNANEATEFDLAGLLKSVTEAQKIRLDEAGARVELVLPEGGRAKAEYELSKSGNAGDVLIAPVTADEFKIEEAFTNYLNNAINHLDGDRNIRIKLEDIGEFWKVSVYNDGAPIPEKSLDKLWDKFYKVDKSRSREYGGSGIGLSIVKAIIEAHKGSYSVENREDGVEFSFTLPKNV
ncbi:MAG: HAMP domain-containing sensor histidine kinase [Eubacteriales bacterium]|nr:HAMP domain-containing sensor histidine kinase [Eubacteriales bacterium]